MFFAAFKPVILAVTKLVLICLVGFIFVKRKRISEKTVVDLTKVLVDFAVPCLLFLKVLENFSSENIRTTAILIASSAITITVGLLLALLVMKIMGINGERRWECGALASLGNTGYFPIALVSTLLVGIESERAIMYIALYILTYSPVLWLFGPWAMTRVSVQTDVCTPREKRSIISPPAMGVIAGILCALTPSVKPVLENHFRFLLDALNMAGRMAIPFSMFVLGGMLASITTKAKVSRKRAMFVVVLVKLILMPACGLLVLFFLKLPHLLGLIILIECGTPCAISLTIMARRWCGDYDFAAKTVFVATTLSLVTIPIFIGLYNHFCA